MTDPLELFLDLAEIVSPPGCERRVADRVVAFARERGMEVIEDDAARTLGGSTGNLLISLAPTRAGGIPIFFCAHLDTVPVDGPVNARVVDGFVRSDGRTILGADDKAAVAAMLAAVDRLCEDGRAHAGVELLFTPMEEVGCKGAKAFDSSVLEGRCGFVFDHAGPIGTYVRSAPSGCLVRLDFRGRAAHAGIAPEEGRSAIQAAGCLVARLQLGRLADGATVNAGIIHGGTAHNVVAARCSVSVDVRARTHDRCLELVREIVAAAGDAATECGCDVAADVEEKYRDYRFAGDELVVRLARRALAVVGAPAEPLDGGGGADASILNERGVPCLNLGNGMGSIHTCDEFIAVEDLHRSVGLVLALIDAAASA